MGGLRGCCTALPWIRGPDSMPGIFGVVGSREMSAPSGSSSLLQIVERMAAAMEYEPQYGRDIFWCPELGACAGRVGWRDGWDVRGTRRVTSTIALMTTGEVAGREPDGREWVEGDDIETNGAGALRVAQAYVRAGESALERETHVSGFLMDRRRGVSLLFNDPYGAERLFLYRAGDRTFFSSEAKAILAVAADTRSFDPEGLAEFLACGCTVGARSLFRGIEILEGGSLLKLQADEPVVGRAYFDRSGLDHVDPVPATRFVDGLADRLNAAVGAAVEQPPNAGISLTGGLDSRMLMAGLDAAPGSVPCYTFGSMYRETLDVSIGRAVAVRCRQPYQVLELGTEFLEGAGKLLSEAVLVSDGYLGMSGAAELYLNRRARAVAGARITGNWGGELLRGVRAFKHAMPRGGFLRPELMTYVRESEKQFVARAGMRDLSFTLFHQMPHQGYGRHVIERSQVRIRSPFLDPDVVRWLYRAPTGFRSGLDGSVAVVERLRPDLLNVATDQGHLGRGGAARLVRRLHYQALIRGEYLTGFGAPNWLLAMTGPWLGARLEQTFRGHNKFQHFREWFQRDWAALVRSTVLDEGGDALRPWFDLGAVERMIDDHLCGRANFTGEIDKLLTVVLTAKLLLAAPGASCS
jgi:asparagine synthase (glutamine-hydrolysing)